MTVVRWIVQKQCQRALTPCGFGATLGLTSTLAGVASQALPREQNTIQWKKPQGRGALDKSAPPWRDDVS